MYNMETKAVLPADSASVATSAKAGPKDIFLHLLAIIALYVSAGSFIALLFQYINVYFPDIVADGDYWALQSAYSGIRWSIAVLVVVFPVYIWISWFLGRMYGETPDLKNIKTRKWLLYFTLFAAAVIIIGDLVTLIYNFLQGELTARFLLKILAVGVVAAAVFWHYLLELRQSRPSAKIFAYPVSAIVLIAVVAGFFVVGSPQEERARKFDERRISDLQMIQGQIINFWQAKEKLPQNLAELSDTISGFIAPQDPETGVGYAYEVADKLNFKLCADFNRPSLGEDVSRVSKPAVPYGEPYFGQENWQHQEGHVCFERKIDPELYRPLPREKR